VNFFLWFVRTGRRQTVRVPVLCQLVTLCHPGLTYILIPDIRALWHSALSAIVPECQKFKM